MKRKNNKGFTLIEVLVTAVILVVGLAGLMYSYVVCHRTIINNTHRFNATLIINQQFEEILRRSTAVDVGTYIGAVQKEYFMQIVTTASTGTATLAENLRKYNLSFANGPNVTPQPGTTLSTIIATVSWEEGGPGKRLSMAMFTNYPF